MKWLVTGGAGFTGTNVVQRLIKEGHEVILLDNLSRPGVQENLHFLKDHFQFDFISGDVRDIAFLMKIFQEYPDIDVILHLAAQVAVTNSIVNPMEDFQINAVGTFNLCEVVRQCAPQAIFLYASTNKVYGDLSHLKLVEKRTRYEFADMPYGVSEKEPLDLRTPYACSKGSAEQYVRDYARTYGLKTVSLRQSCIYGPHQFGLEDQGWIAWFTIAAALDKPIRIYGNGKQVRDVLFVDDLVECYIKATDHIDQTAGKIYNIGGGPTNTRSLLELTADLEMLHGKRIRSSFEDWRPGDQRVFICDIRKAKDDFGWQPTTSINVGIEKLSEWVYNSLTLIKDVLK